MPINYVLLEEQIICYDYFLLRSQISRQRERKRVDLFNQNVRAFMQHQTPAVIRCQYCRCESIKREGHFYFGIDFSLVGYLVEMKNTFQVT